MEENKKSHLNQHAALHEKSATRSPESNSPEVLEQSEFYSGLRYRRLLCDEVRHWVELQCAREERSVREANSLAAARGLLADAVDILERLESRRARRAAIALELAGTLSNEEKEVPDGTLSTQGVLREAAPLATASCDKNPATCLPVSESSFATFSRTAFASAAKASLGALTPTEKAVVGKRALCADQEKLGWLLDKVDEIFGYTAPELLQRKISGLVQRTYEIAFADGAEKAVRS